MTKDTYSKAKRKKLVRDFLIQRFQFEHIVGLPGPDINQYLDYYNIRGAKTFELYENNSKIALSQLSRVDRKIENISLICNDVLNAEYVEEGVLYDLDFCCTVPTAEEHIKKFRNNFIMTFSIRPFGVQQSIKEFFGIRNEWITNIEKFILPIKHTIFTTENGKYTFTTYRDTTPMLCFAKT